MSSDRKYVGNYLVIGSTSHPGEVHSFDWSDPQLQQLNFDLISTYVIHLDAIPNQLISTGGDTTRIVAKHPETGNLELLSDMPTQILSNLQFLGSKLNSSINPTETTLFMICSPVNRFIRRLFRRELFLSKDEADKLSIEFTQHYPENYGNTQLVDLNLEFFSAIEFHMILEPNISMINPTRSIQPYFEEFNQFDFVFRVDTHHTPLAHSFYNAILAFKQIIHDLSVIVLPQPKLVTPYDANEAVLRKVIGIESEESLTVPDWIDDYNTRRQISIMTEVMQLKLQISSLKRQIKEQQSSFSLIRSFQRILFTRGEILNRSVLDLFEAMGFNPQPSSVVGGYDFLIDSSSAILIFQVLYLENSHLERSALRQLNQWVERKEEQLDFGKTVKGVTIINHEFETDPKEREGIALAEAAKKYVEKMEFGILTTPQLFQLYQDIEAGNLSTEAVISMLTDVVGLAEL